MRPQNIESDLIQLCARAREVGATEAVSLAARDIVVDERVRLKCLAPRCPSYGTLLCPPNVMPIPEFRQILARYRHALLVQVEIPFSRPSTPSASGDPSLAELSQQGGYESQLRSLVFPRVADLLEGLESAAFGLGYRFAAALGATRCYVCETCVRQGPCRVPYRGRPSMQALGIDVIETAAHAGLVIRFSAAQPVVLTSLLLVD